MNIYTNFKIETSYCCSLYTSHERHSLLLNGDLFWNSFAKVCLWAHVRTSRYLLTYNIQLYNTRRNFAMNWEINDFYLMKVPWSLIIFLHPGYDWLTFSSLINKRPPHFKVIFFLQIEQFLYLFRSLQGVQGGMYTMYVLAY